MSFTLAKLKVFNSKSIKRLVYCIFCFVTVISTLPAIALEKSVDKKQIDNLSQDPIESLLPMLGGLLVVLAFIFLLAFLAKRFNKFGSNSNLIKVIETCAIGHKEKLSIVSVGDDYFLIGITASSIQQIGKLAASNFSVAGLSEDENKDKISPKGFSSIISKFMTGELTNDLLEKKKSKSDNQNCSTNSKSSLSTALEIE